MAQGNPSFPVGSAATNWVDGNGTSHIRVYSTDGYGVTERCWDGDGWTTGGFSQSGAAVSATSWFVNGGAHIRVYCTSEDSTIEWCIDQGGGWYQGSYTNV